MKKIILLLILPLTALLAIDFTMTKEGLFTTTTQSPTSTPTSTPTPSTEPEAENPYLEPVNLPKCDANNPEVQFIRSTADWSKINYSSKRIFCVSPGDYRSLGNIKLTVSGIADKRRYIVLNNENDIHPGKLAEAERFIIDSMKVYGSYWIFDRMAIEHGADYRLRLEEGASFNIINRFYGNDIAGAIVIGHLAHNNTIQNSRFENQRDPGYDGPVAVQIMDWGVKELEVHNTKVINNEFYNQNDGFQIVRTAVDGHTKPWQDVNAEGTILDSNLFHKDVPYMENAIDLKGGSLNPNNPVIISNNVMWGYRKHPDYVSGSYGSGKTAILAHHDPKNIHFINNIIFDSDEAIRAASDGPRSGFSKAFVDSIIENNVFYKCGGNGRYAIFMASSINLHMNNNYYIKSQHDEGYIYANTGTFNNNKVALPYGGNITFDVHPDYPNSSSFQDGMDATQTVSNETLGDFIFTWDKFTNSPQQITLPKVMAPGHEFPKWN